MDMTTRLEINSIVDRMTGDGDTFDGSDAKRLVELVPMRKPPIAKTNYTASGPGHSGYSPGVGNVSMQDEEKSGEAEYLGDEPVRAGAYKIYHQPGRLEIDQPWTGTMEDWGEGKQCLLEYGTYRKWRLSLYRPVVIPINLGFFSVKIGFGRWVPWKTAR